MARESRCCQRCCQSAIYGFGLQLEAGPDKEKEVS